jgi:hypothetical protein
MIVHVSIPSSRPRETAELLAKLVGGAAIPFPPIPGGWVAVPQDGSGQTIEVYPLGTVARPGVGEPDPSVTTPPFRTKPWEVQIGQDPLQGMASAHHLALATKLSREEVLRLGEERGLRAVACERGGIFGVVELWIENQFLVEVVTEPELERYLAFMKRPETAHARFGGKP